MLPDPKNSFMTHRSFFLLFLLKIFQSKKIFNFSFQTLSKLLLIEILQFSSLSKEILFF